MCFFLFDKGRAFFLKKIYFKFGTIFPWNRTVGFQGKPCFYVYFHKLDINFKKTLIFFLKNGKPVREPSQAQGQAQGLMPHDKEAEQGVLGAVIQNNEAFYQVEAILEPESFFSPAHRELFKAMQDLMERKEPIDEITLSHQLKNSNQLDHVGGIVYIAELVDLTPVAINVTYYAEIVRDKHQLRSLITTAMEIASKGKDNSGDVEALIHQAEEEFLKLANRHKISSYAHLKDILRTNFDQLEQAQDRTEDYLGLPTGFTELDKLFNGLKPSDLIIIAARPSMGKTSFVLNIAKYAASHGKAPVVVFSLEMAKEQLSMRLLCMEAKVEQNRLLQGNLDGEEWDSLAIALGKLSEVNLFIDETPELTPLKLKNIVRRIHAEHGLGMIVVDYLQLMRTHRRTDNREQEIADISRSLKAIAKEFNVPVIAAAQLSRAVDARPNKRPLLSDLRESGSIEQDADIVMFIYRDERYNPETEDRGVAEIHVAKNRNGPITTDKHGARLAFIPKFATFANLDLRSAHDDQYN